MFERWRVRRPSNRHLGLAFLAILSLSLLYAFFYGSNAQFEDDALRVDVINAWNNDGDNRWPTVEDPKKPYELPPVSFKPGGCKVPKLRMENPEIKGFFSVPEPLRCEEKSERNWAFIDRERRFRLIPDKKGAKCKLVVFERKNDQENTRGEEVFDVLDGDVCVFRVPEDLFIKSLNMMTISPNIRLIEDLVRNADGEQLMSVSIISFDSLSHMTFRRKLPKTVAVLERIGAVILNGYNIVGDGTPAAFLPILTSKNEEELPNTRKHVPFSSFVDEVYPFIWKNFSAKGYVTMYGEDEMETGIYQYRLKGFRQKPTHHFPSTFMVEVMNTLWKSQRNCCGSETMHDNWFRIIREFHKGYASVPRFMLMHHGELSHDDVNMIALADDSLSTLLQDLLEEGHLDNTLLIVMADHGHRFATLRSTHQGMLEERLPFMSLRLPSKFRLTDTGRIMQKNLVANREMLTSPFDIHQTLWDVMLKPTREEASILQRVLLIRDAILKTLNWLTQGQRALCAELIGARVKQALILDSSEETLRSGADEFPAAKGVVAYQLQIETQPKSALYETSVLLNDFDWSVLIDVASISRLNKYGNTSTCILDRAQHLAAYCVCHNHAGSGNDLNSRNPL